MRTSYSRLSFEPPYEALLKGVLSFSILADSENSLKRLEELRGQFASAGDRKGLHYCREIAKLGRRRAEAISGNQRVDPQKRLQKKEIAFWFQTWLEMPEVFEGWLALRKQTPSFQALQQSEMDGLSKKKHRSHGPKL